jgi:hypothetical protein
LTDPKGQVPDLPKQVKIDRALEALALEGGNSRAAARYVKEHFGISVHHGTIGRWRRQHEDRYQELRAEALPRLAAEAAEIHRQAAQENIEAEQKARRAAIRKVKDIPARDLPGAVRNFATAAGIHADKAARLNGDYPPAVNVTVSLQETIKALIAKGARVVPPDELETERARQLPRSDEGDAAP